MIDDHRLLEEAKTAIASGDLEGAVSRLQILVRRGAPEGEYLLGEAYEFGDGLPVQLEQAIRLYRSAYAKGDGRAALALGRLADPTIRHTNEAMEALRVADAGQSTEFYRAAFSRFSELAAHGDAEATHLLAQCYLHGWGTEVDVERALALFTAAFDSGYVSSGNELFSIYASPESGHYEPRKAKHYYTETRRAGRLVVRDPSYES